MNAQDKSFLSLVMSTLKQAVDAVNPGLLVKQAVRISKNTFFIDNYRVNTEGRPVHLVGAGKGAAEICRGLHEIMGSRISGGTVIVPAEAAEDSGPVSCLPGSHPLADQLSLESSKKLISYCQQEIAPGHLVLFLLTGGASALLEYPLPGITGQDLCRLYHLLVRSGMNIHETNCVRTWFSRVKGGGMAGILNACEVYTLALSDVIGSTPHIIGSGPTVPVKRNRHAVVTLLHKYGLTDSIPRICKNLLLLDRGPSDMELNAELPRKAPPFILLGDNRKMLDFACTSLQKSGNPCRIESTAVRGRTSAVASRLGDFTRKQRTDNFKPPAVFLFGGETTVKVRGKGRGGRNQELMLCLLSELTGVGFPFFACSFASDGVDGPTDAAGAWIDHHTRKKADSLNLSLEAYIDNNDSYGFFEKMDQLIKTGPTGTNVMDMVLIALL